MAHLLSSILLIYLICSKLLCPHFLLNLLILLLLGIAQGLSIHTMVIYFLFSFPFSNYKVKTVLDVFPNAPQLYITCVISYNPLFWFIHFIWFKDLPWMRQRKASGITSYPLSNRALFSWRHARVISEQFLIYRVYCWGR